MQQAKTLRGADMNHYYQRFIVNSKLSFHVYRPRKLKTFEDVHDARFIANALVFSVGNAKLV